MTTNEPRVDPVSTSNQPAAGRKDDNRERDGAAGRQSGATHRSDAGGTGRDEKSPGTIEIPGRPGMEKETEKDKAYGPGGGRSVGGGEERSTDLTDLPSKPTTAPSNPVAGPTVAPTAGRTAAGGDTVAL